MCELLGLSSNHPIDVTLSLDVLARRGGDTGPHRDGWGIGYFEGNDVRLIKDTQAAANSEWVGFVQRHRLRSRTVLSHIRKATQGDVSFANTQPFVRELAGRTHVFAHNGKLPGIEGAMALAERGYRPLGETDSEHAFCLLLERLAPLWWDSTGIPPAQERLAAVRRFAAAIAPMGPANFLYSDGDLVFAHGNRRTQAPNGEIRPPGLHWLCRQCEAESALEVPGVNIRGRDQSVALIASVPLTEERWRPFEEGQVLCVRDGLVVDP